MTQYEILKHKLDNLSQATEKNQTDLDSLKTGRITNITIDYLKNTAKYELANYKTNNNLTNPTFKDYLIFLNNFPQNLLPNIKVVPIIAPYSYDSTAFGELDYILIPQGNKNYLYLTAYTKGTVPATIKIILYVESSNYSKTIKT